MLKNINKSPITLPSLRSQDEKLMSPLKETTLFIEIDLNAK